MFERDLAVITIFSVKYEDWDQITRLRIAKNSVIPPNNASFVIYLFILDNTIHYQHRVIEPLVLSLVWENLSFPVPHFQFENKYFLKPFGLL